MKNIIIKFWQFVMKLKKWYMKGNKVGLPNGPCWIMGIIILIVILLCYFEFLQGKLLIWIAITSFVVMALIALFFSEDKWIRRFTKGKFATPIEVLKNFSNCSYFLYGVFFWIFTCGLWLYSLLCILLEIIIPITEFTIVNVMGFTFLWFIYHLYMNNELGSVENRQSVIKLKLQLFTAIASTLSTLFLLFDAWEEFKIMVTMLALVFTWLRYIIDAETHNNSSIDVNFEIGEQSDD